MKPRILRYFCTRVLFHLAGNSACARQKEYILKEGRKSCDHKHSHSRFAHKIHVLTFVRMPEIHERAFLTQAWDCESPPRVPSFLSTGNMLPASTGQEYLPWANRTPSKAIAEAKETRAGYWEQFTALKEMSETGTDPETLYQWPMNFYLIKFW